MPVLKLIHETFNDLRPIVPYVGRWWLCFIADLGVAVIQPLRSLARGGPITSIVKFAPQLLLVLLRYSIQFVLTVGALLLNALSSFINNAFIKQSNERALDKQELQYLQSIFGNKLNYDVMRIQTGGVKEKLKISPQAVGSDIFLRQVWGVAMFNQDSSLTTAGLRLLGHEACHVWQFQHHGAGYIGDSLMTQVLDVFGRKLGVHWSDGYDLQRALRAKFVYDECNVEQQAVMAELIGVACSVESSGQITQGKFSEIAGFYLDESEFALVQDAHMHLGGRRGVKWPGLGEPSLGDGI